MVAETHLRVVSTAGINAMCCHAQAEPGSAADWSGFNGNGIANYELGPEIGSGMFSTVRVATHRATGAKVAVKIISNIATDEATVNQEIRAMKLVKGHPHVVNLFEVIKDDEYTYLIMEYAPGGTMDDYLMKYGKVSESRARLWTHQLVDAVRHCHNNRVVHMDIKPANLYLDENENIKLGDFGLAAVTIDAYREGLQQAAGSPVYAAPEVYRVGELKSFVGPSAAMWAVGTVLHAMLTRSLPFNVECYPDGCPPYQPPEDVSQSCAELLRALLSPDPQVRPTEEDILQHPWMTQDSAACCCECICVDCDDTRSLDSAATDASATLDHPSSVFGFGPSDMDGAASQHHSLTDSAQPSPSPSPSPPPEMSASAYGTAAATGRAQCAFRGNGASAPATPHKASRRMLQRHRHYVCGKRSSVEGDIPESHTPTPGSMGEDDQCRSRAKANMRSLGIPAEVVDKAARSSAVFDHLAATFSILLTQECRLAHCQQPLLLTENCSQIGHNTSDADH